MGRDTGLYVFNIEPLRLPNEEASCLHFLFFYFERLLIAPDQILGEPALATCTERTADCRHGWQLHLCASRAQGQSGSPNPASSQLPRPTVIENRTNANHSSVSKKTAVARSLHFQTVDIRDLLNPKRGRRKALDTIFGKEIDGIIPFVLVLVAPMSLLSELFHNFGDSGVRIS